MKNSILGQVKEGYASCKSCKTECVYFFVSMYRLHAHNIILLILIIILIITSMRIKKKKKNFARSSGIQTCNSNSFIFSHSLFLPYKSISFQLLKEASIETFVCSYTCRHAWNWTIIRGCMIPRISYGFLAAAAAAVYLLCILVSEKSRFLMYFIHCNVCKCTCNFLFFFIPLFNLVALKLRTTEFRTIEWKIIIYMFCIQFRRR